MADGLTLVVRREVKASPDRLFAAWTDAAQLTEWWGPDGVACLGAEIDLRPAGAYRIGNRLADGSEIWIGGVFERVDPPNELVYSWKPEHLETPPERVRVQFRPAGGGTEIILTHERIADAPTRDSHEAGWTGCLDGLTEFLAA